MYVKIMNVELHVIYVYLSNETIIDKKITIFLYCVG